MTPIIKLFNALIRYPPGSSLNIWEALQLILFLTAWQNKGPDTQKPAQWDSATSQRKLHDLTCVMYPLTGQKPHYGSPNYSSSAEL